MQCPPTPAPGQKVRIPYGFVAAARVISVGSSPNARLAPAISFAQAMLTARNVFS